MSVDRCSRCSDLVDTDDEPEAYVEVGNMRTQTQTVCMCRNCRERHEEELERRDGPHWLDREFSPAQQAIIDQTEDESEDTK